MTVRVFCTTTFEAWHRWPDAPVEHLYLRSLHRHLFHVRVEWDVSHADRDLEFIHCKRLTDKAIQDVLDETTVSQYSTEEWACEHWAEWLLEAMQASRVEVSEDGENGAVVTL